jgi:protein-tyrosine-phosphatase
MNILVLCTGNSARSILLEHILAADPRIAAWSAGSHPTGHVHPAAIALLREKGVDSSAARSKSWDEFGLPDAPQMDAVITVCGAAAGETCPFWPGAPVRAHWGVDDPAAAPQAEWATAFATAHDLLSARAQALFALPFETFDRAGLQSALSAIGKEAP